MDTNLITIIIGLLLFVFVFFLFRGSKKKIAPKSPAKPSSKTPKKEVAKQETTTPRSEEKAKPTVITEITSYVEFSEEDEARLRSLELLAYVEDENSQRIQQSLQSTSQPHPQLISLIKPVNEPKALYRIISKDLKLVAKILKVTNSSYYGLNKPINNLQHAMVYLGVMQVQNIATNFALRDSMKFTSNKQTAAYDKIWKVAFCASEIVRVFAQELGIDNASGLATSCQLSYLGDSAFIMSDEDASDLYLGNADLIERISVAQEKFGGNQSALAKLMVKSWNMPDDVIMGVENKYLPLTDDFSHTSMSKEELKSVLIYYYASVIAEKVMMDQNDAILDAPSLKYADNGLIECFHAEKQLENAELTRLHQVACNPSFKNKMLELMH